MKIFSEVIAEDFYKRGSIPQYVAMYYPHLIDEHSRLAMIKKIRRYANNQAIPSYEEAKELLNNLGIQMDEEELLFVLKNTKSTINTKENEQRANYLPRVSISIGDINNELLGMSQMEVNNEIKNRIKSTTKSNTAKEYIAKLIEMDLLEILLEDVEEEDENS